MAEAIDELTEPAVRDTKTGDYYFPELRLSLPMNSELSGVKYSYDYEEPEHLRITTRQISSAAKSKLRGSNNSNRVFEVLSEYQACERGILLSDGPLTGDVADGLTAGWQKQLSDGRTLHSYTEDACPAQADQLDKLKAIVSY